MAARYRNSDGREGPPAPLDQAIANTCEPLAPPPTSPNSMNVLPKRISAVLLADGKKSDQCWILVVGSLSDRMLVKDRRHNDRSEPLIRFACDQETRRLRQPRADGMGE